MPEWSFLTSHARVLLCIAHDPGLRLRDIAVRLDITERTAPGVLTDLVQAGYVTKTKDGRATITRSRPTCRCLSPAPASPPSGNSSPSSWETPQAWPERPTSG
jgi:hypothetical protein